MSNQDREPASYMPDIVLGHHARLILVSALEVLGECLKRVENKHSKARDIWPECYHAVEAIDNLLGD